MDTPADEPTLTEEDLLSAIEDEVAWASEARDERVSQYEEAKAYFEAESPGPPPAEEREQGMSSIVSRDVQDAVFAVQAEIMPAFSGVSPVEFQPLTEEDETQATIETTATNHVAQNCGIYMATNRAVMDILLAGEGVVKVWWEDRRTVEHERHDSLPITALPGLLQPRQEGEQVDITDGEMDEATGTMSGGLRRSGVRAKPAIESVSAEEFLASVDFEDADKVDDVRFLAHQRPISRSDLIALGFDREMVEELDETSTAPRDYSRKHLGRYETGHPSTEYIMCCESYYLIDYDGDGIAERRLIITAGGTDGTDTLLYNEPWDVQPFATGVGYLGLDDWEGTSLFERIQMIQDVKTDLLRELVNATKRNMRQRLGLIEGDANLEDAQTSQMGGYVRMRTPQGIVPIPDVQLPQSVFSTLEYLDQIRTDRGGGAIDATASARALSQGGDWSLERMMSAAEQLNAMVAKNITETLVKAIFRKLHKLLRQYQQNPMMVPGSAGWTQTEPDQWSPREDMVVSMGMSVGERSRRMGALQMIGQDQTALAQGGKEGILVDDAAVYQARVDMARMAGLPTPEQYYVDPQSQQAQQAAQAMAQQAQQAQEMQMQQQQEMQQFQYSLITDVEKVKGEYKLQSDQMKMQMDTMRQQMDMIQKTMDQRIKMAEIDASVDAEEGKREIDKLQAVTSLEASRRAARGQGA